jgi:hypothetical protein
MTSSSPAPQHEANAPGHSMPSTSPGLPAPRDTVVRARLVTFLLLCRQCGGYGVHRPGRLAPSTVQCGQTGDW